MTSFDYRRTLERQDWIRLIGAAAAAGTALGGVVLYFGRIWLQRVPLPHGDAVAVAGTTGKRAARLSPRTRN